MDHGARGSLDDRSGHHRHIAGHYDDPDEVYNGAGAGAGAGVGAGAGAGAGAGGRLPPARRQRSGSDASQRSDESAQSQGGAPDEGPGVAPGDQGGRASRDRAYSSDGGSAATPKKRSVCSLSPI